MLALATLLILSLPALPQVATDVIPEAERLLAPPPNLPKSCPVDPRIAIDATNTPGDADSLFRIDAPGSYYLPHHVTGQAGKSALEVAASDVTIDLMGFTLQGVPQSLKGIAVDGTLERVAVRNGVVAGFGQEGIDLDTANASRLEELRVSDNGGHGLSVGAGSLVSRCISKGNAGTGIYVLAHSLIADCIAEENGLNGFWTSIRCQVERSVAEANQNVGFAFGNGALAFECEASANTSSGFATGSGALQRCTANYNGAHGFDASADIHVLECVADDNAEFGFRVGGESVVRGNVARDNGSLGVGGGFEVKGSRSTLEDNVSVSNEATGYLVSQFGNLLRRNSASANVVNWSVVGGNACRVLIASTVAGILGDAGGVAMGPSDPNANYTF